MVVTLHKKREKPYKLIVKKKILNKERQETYKLRMMPVQLMSCFMKNNIMGSMLASKQYISFFTPTNRAR